MRQFKPKEKRCFYGLLIIGIAAICFAAFLWMKQKPADDFWGQLGITKKQVEEVRLVYEDQEVRMEDQTLEDFLDTLSTMEKTEVSDTHEFCPSDVGVIFVAEGRQYPVTFYWFPYLAEEINSFETMEDRVDIKLDDTLHHFRLTTAKTWTEEKMLQMYDQYAEKQGLLQRCKLRCADRIEQSESPFCQETYSLQEVLEQSDLVFLGTYIDFYAPDMFLYPRNLSRKECIERFHIDEVLKGSSEEPYYNVYGYHVPNYMLRYVDPAHPTQRVTDWIISSASIYDPFYKEGGQYLICVKQQEPGISREGDFYFGQYGSAIVDGDTLFPRFNTENHPFYNVKIQTVRDLLAE